MKQTIFMVVATFIGTIGVIVDGPFIAVAVYYLFAVLKPQAIWDWALPPSISWSQFPAGAAIVGLALYTVGLVPIGGSERPAQLPFSRRHALYLVFALWIGVTYFTAFDQTVSWPWLLEYSKIFLMFFIACLVVRTLPQIWTLYLTATGTLIYIAYEVNSLYLFDRRLDIFHHGYGGLDNNGAGLMLAMAVPLAVGAWEGLRGIWRWALIASIPPVIHAVLITYSRGAMVALLAAAPVLLWRSRFRLQFGAVAICLALLLPVLAGPEIRTRFFSVQQYQQDDSANSRFNSWMAAIRIANEHPVAGVGIRNANLFSNKFGADIEGRTIHSQYLQTLADAGYTGLGIYLLALAGMFLGIWRKRRLLRESDDPVDIRAVAMLNGVEGAMVVFCVGAAFLSLEVFELPYLLILLGLQLSVVPAHAPLDAPARVAPRHIPAFGRDRHAWPASQRPRQAPGR
jgi:probable O-glycosylation ligase (exosortase A-associated)